jgi:hypothetical protein
VINSDVCVTLLNLISGLDIGLRILSTLLEFNPKVVTKEAMSFKYGSSDSLCIESTFSVLGKTLNGQKILKFIIQANPGIILPETLNHPVDIWCLATSRRTATYLIPSTQGIDILNILLQQNIFLDEGCLTSPITLYGESQTLLSSLSSSHKGFEHINLMLNKSINSISDKAISSMNHVPFETNIVKELKVMKRRAWGDPTLPQMYKLTLTKQYYDDTALSDNTISPPSTDYI